MKKTHHIKFLLLLAGIVMFASCDKDAPTPYFGKTGITFQAAASIYTDYVHESNIQYPEESYGKMYFIKEYFFTYETDASASRLVKLPLAVHGYTTDFDRPFLMEVDKELSTLPDEYYEIDERNMQIMKNAKMGTIGIRLTKPVNVAESATLVLRLLPNEYFGFVNGDGATFTITVSNVNYKPQYWDAAATIGGKTTTDQFGVYSNNKMEFIHEVLYNYWDEGTVDDEWGEEEEDGYMYGFIFREYASLDGIKALMGATNSGTIIARIRAVLTEAYRTGEYPTYDHTEYNERWDEWEHIGTDKEITAPMTDEVTGKPFVFGY